MDVRRLHPDRVGGVRLETVERGRAGRPGGDVELHDLRLRSGEVPGGLPVTCFATQTVTTANTVVSSSTFAELAVVDTAAFFTHCTAQPVPAVICRPPSSARAVPPARQALRSTRP